MRYTICTYEWPAARHDIDRWSTEMTLQRRLVDRIDVAHTIHPVSLFHLSRVTVVRETLVAIGIGDKATPTSLRHAFARHDLPDGRKWDKALHFGKVPSGELLTALTTFWHDHVQPAPSRT